MSFIYEKVGEDNLKLMEEICFRNWDKEPIPCIPSRMWCIDRENSVIFVPIGSFRGETPHYADLSYKGRVVRLETSSYINDSNVVSCVIKRMYIPKSIWTDKKDIVRKTVDACEAYFIGKSIAKDLKVEVTFENEAECVEVDYNGR